VVAAFLMSAVLACTEPEPIRPADTHAPDSPDSGDSDSTGSTGSTDTGDTGEAIFAVPDDPYLLSLHTCPFSEESCGNPMNHTVRVAGSEDGATWRLLEEIEPFSGSVPDLLVRDGILYIYSLPELRRIDLSDDSLLPTTELTFLTRNGDPSDVLHADPSMILDEAGNIVMFFLEGSEDSDPASCPQTPCTKRILSATEVSGSQGTVFTVDEGARLEVVITDDGPSRLSDPDIFAGPDGFVLLVSRGQSVRVYTSETLRGDYVALSLDNLTPGTGGVPAGGYIDGRYWLYVSVDAGGTSDIQWAALEGIELVLPDDALSPIVLEGLEGDLLMASPGFWAVP
jgi:hypothetical protein